MRCGAQWSLTEQLRRRPGGSTGLACSQLQLPFLECGLNRRGEQSKEEAVECRWFFEKPGCEKKKEQGHWGVAEWVKIQGFDFFPPKKREVWECLYDSEKLSVQGEWENTGEARVNSPTMQSSITLLDIPPTSVQTYVHKKPAHKCS